MADALLKGHSALVTGASRGIGAAVARALSGSGATVWLVARSTASLEELARETGGTAVVTDLADGASVRACVGRVTTGLGGSPDILVNAAGVFTLAPLAETEPEDLERNLEVNLRGAFRMIRAFLPGMLERGSGRIVNIGSVAGRRAFPGNAAYAVSKFGLRGLHEVLLEEIRGTGVQASLIEPAATDTGLWDPFDPDSDPGLPDRGGMLRPGDVAEAVLFVATRPEGVQVPLLQIERA